MVYPARDGPQDMGYACTCQSVLAIMPLESRFRTLIDYPEARAMISSSKPYRTVNTYNDGRPFTLPRGRYAPRESLEDHLAACHPVVTGCPTPEEFIREIEREMKIRFYGSRTIKTYKNALVAFLRWFGGPPHRVTREHVRDSWRYWSIVATVRRG